MSTLKNVDAAANANQGILKPSRAPDAPTTTKGVSLEVRLSLNGK